MPRVKLSLERIKFDNDWLRTLEEKICRVTIFREGSELGISDTGNIVRNHRELVGSITELSSHRMGFDQGKNNVHKPYSQRTLAIGRWITVPTVGLQYIKTGFDQKRKYVVICM